MIIFSHWKPFTSLLGTDGDFTCDIIFNRNFEYRLLKNINKVFSINFYF